MIGEASTIIGLAVSAWGGYHYFIASKLGAHVEEYGGAARLSVKNNGKHTAYLRKIAVHSPKDAMLSAFDPIVMWIAGGHPWEAPAQRPSPKVAQLDVDMEVAPGATVTFGFYFWSPSLASNCRIKLDAWESSLIAKNKVILIPITPKAISVNQK